MLFCKISSLTPVFGWWVLAQVAGKVEECLPPVRAVHLDVGVWYLSMYPHVGEMEKCGLFPLPTFI